MSDSPDAPATDASVSPAEADAATEGTAADEAAAEAPRSPFLQKLSAPISDAAPTGIKVRYEDSFQKLKGEVDKIGSASGGADYDLIVELAKSILTSESKDLTVTYYLSLGLMRTHGHEGLAESMGALRVLTDTFWEGLHPKKTAARSKVLQLFAERVTAHLEEVAPKPADRSALETLQRDLEALQTFYTEDMGTNAPVLSRVTRLVRDTLKKIPKPTPPAPAKREPTPSESAPAPKPETDAAPPSTPQPPSTAPAPTPTATAAAPSSGPIASASDATVAVLKAASFLREHDLTNPLPYLLSRSVRWGELKQVPPSLPDAPRDLRRTYLEGLLQQGEYLALVENGEQDFPNAPFFFWLDLQRLVAAALERLGPAYSQARRAVEGAVAGLVHRLPGLPSLSFSDGVPAADPLTVEWLGDLVSSGGNDAVDMGNAELVEAYDAARQTLAGGNLQDALQQLRATSLDGSARMRFMRDLYVADLCFKGKALGVALPLLDHLTHLMDAHGLRAWEPALASRCLSLRHACLMQLLASAQASEKADLFARAQDTFADLCALDPAHALGQQPST